MNETLKTIKNRFSCRSYTGEAVEKEKVDAIALAGVQSPSGLNQQPWKISVLQNKELIDEMNDVLMDILSKQEDRTAYDRMMSRGGKVFYNAPLMYVIGQKPDKGMDTGIVAENMALAAKYGIQAIPTMIVFKDGEPVQTHVGFAGAPQIEQLINNHL